MDHPPQLLLCPVSSIEGYLTFAILDVLDQFGPPGTVTTPHSLGGVRRSAF